MTKKNSFPTKIFVDIEKEGEDEFLNAQLGVQDFSWDNTEQRTIGVYRLEKTITAEQLISIKG